MTNNDMRLHVINDMVDLSEAMKRKIVILSALGRKYRDTGQTSSYELYDQITLIFDLQLKLQRVLEHSRKVLGE
jgi:gluconate kinase